MKKEEARMRAQACRAALMRDGVQEMHCVMILFAMVDGAVDYSTALDAWADYQERSGWDAFRWHREFCYYLLRAGIEDQPATYFDRKAKEVRFRED